MIIKAITIKKKEAFETNPDKLYGYITILHEEEEQKIQLSQQAIRNMLQMAQQASRESIADLSRGVPLAFQRSLDTLEIPTPEETRNPTIQEG